MMGGEKFDEIEKQTGNRFLNLYHLFARGKSGRPFDYYFASRNDLLEVRPLKPDKRPEGMAIFALTDVSDRAPASAAEKKELRLVMIRQYRYPIGDYLYELPAGLIEDGESAGQAAIREMQEETGLTLRVYEGGKNYYRSTFYLAQGLTDEGGVMVYGFADGQVSAEGQEDSEDIEVLYVDKPKAREILASGKVSARAALLLIQFLQLKEETPFAFLDQ